MGEEVMTPQSVCRSPLSYEIVDPTGVGAERQRQMARTAEQREHPITEAAETDPLRLFNMENNPATVAIINEKPEHRLIVYLKSRGLSNKEVAERTGYSQTQISLITRQPWFRIRIVQELKEAGMNKLAKLLEASAVDSVFTLLEIRDDTEAPKAVRRACADSLLDRWLGKATVHVSRDDDRPPSTPEIVAVDEELRQIENQLKESTNGTTEDANK